jgi:hypothetical protein
MGRSLAEFHELLADHLVSAKRKHDGRPGPGEPGYLNQDSQNAVTVWRRFAHLASGYANGADVRGIRPTGEAFWADGVDRDRFLALLSKRSRFNRCDANGEAQFYDDSVRHWECSLARKIMWTAELISAARKTGNSETIKRIELDHEVTVQFARAYTGVSLAEFRRIVNDRAGENVSMAFATEPGKYADHPMVDLITANRPTF